MPYLLSLHLCPKPNVSVQGFLLGTKVGKIDFVHGIILVHHFRTGILDRFYGFSLKNPKKPKGSDSIESEIYYWLP